MIGNKRVLAIVPARRGSKGLQLKNIRLLGGKPLLAWPVEAALNSKHVDRVVVSTDCPEFADVARRFGADVPFIRPADLSGDLVSSGSVVCHAIEELSASGEDYDYIVLMEPTSPLTDSDDVDTALSILNCRRDTADAIVGVSEIINSHPQYAVSINSRGLISPIHGGKFENLPRRQDLERLFIFDGSIYISDVSVFREARSFYHERTLPYLMPRWKSLEIDDLLDFICVEAIIRNRTLFDLSD